MALCRDRAAPSWPERPRVVAARSLRSLPEDAWLSLWDAGGEPHARGRRLAAGWLVLGGEASAALVASLAMALHGPGRTAGGKVGAAWRLRDDPLAPAGLSGGRFDDAGFATRPTALANGVETVGTLGVTGHLRRPSFRDAPVPLFTTLVVEEGHDLPPPEGFFVSGLRIHRLEPGRWILELDGCWLQDGLPSGTADRLRLPVRPPDLVARCARSIGSATGHANGVITPVLAFEGIRFDGSS